MHVVPRQPPWCRRRLRYSPLGPLTRAVTQRCWFGVRLTVWIHSESPSRESVQMAKESRAWNVRSQKLFCRTFFLPLDTWNCKWGICFLLLSSTTPSPHQALFCGSRLNNAAYTIKTQHTFFFGEDHVNHKIRFLCLSGTNLHLY